MQLINIINVIRCPTQKLHHCYCFLGVLVGVAVGVAVGVITIIGLGHVQWPI